MIDFSALLDREGIFHWMPRDKTDAAIKLGWLPTEYVGSRNEIAMRCFCWIDCACGRGMRLPL